MVFKAFRLWAFRSFYQGLGCAIVFTKPLRYRFCKYYYKKNLIRCNSGRTAVSDGTSRFPDSNSVKRIACFKKGDTFVIWKMY